MPSIVAEKRVKVSPGSPAIRSVLTHGIPDARASEYARRKSSTVCERPTPESTSGQSD